MKKYIAKEESWKKILLIFAFAIITLWMMWLGRTIYEGERALYLDDLSLYKAMTNLDTSFWAKVFHAGSNKTRYVMNVIYMVFFALVGNEFERIDILLQLWNILIAFLFFGAAMYINENKKYERKVLLALCSTLCFCTSRFSYYTFTEVHGMMESLALILTVWLVAFLLKDGRSYSIKYYYSVILFFVLVWVHERYITLLMVFFAYILFGVLQKKIYLKDSVKLVAAPVGIILSFFGIRYLVFGKTVLDGTGGVALYDTFNIAGIIKFIMKQILYVFGGINAENEEYLNGIDPRNVHLFIYLFM